MHFFADLRPYICTFANCNMELAQFPTLASWADHEFSEHRIIRWWDCFECAKQCYSEIEWKRHLELGHHRTFVGVKYHVAEKMALKTRVKAAESEECPLCQAILGKSRREFVKHVGRHMEEIALMALPREFNEEPDAHSTSPDAESSPSLTSVVSRENDGNSELHATCKEAPFPTPAVPDMRGTGSEPVPPVSLKPAQILSPKGQLRPGYQIFSKDMKPMNPRKVRSHNLSQAQRARAALMRKVGACQECHRAHRAVRKPHPRENNKRAHKNHSAYT